MNSDYLQQQIDALNNQIEEARALMAENPDMAELVESEIQRLEQQKAELEQSASTPMNANTSDGGTEGDSSEVNRVNHNVAILEVRAAAGGDEAGLFAGDLLRMYLRFAEENKWMVEELDRNEGGIGQIKQIVLNIKGKDAFSKLRFEGGVHRVQRVPKTESSGRIHTSTATVAV